MKSGGIEYDTTDQSKEMLYQIMTGEKYSKIAIKLLVEIDILTVICPQYELPTYLQVQHLALSIVVHPSSKTIQINAFAHPNGNKTSSGSSLLFQRKNTAKQCVCCKMYEYCIDVKDKTDKKDVQVYCFGAQMYHCMEYAKKHEEEVALNAAIYESMNTPKHMKYVNYKCKPPLLELEDTCKHEFIADLQNDEESDQNYN